MLGPGRRLAVGRHALDQSKISARFKGSGTKIRGNTKTLGTDKGGVLRMHGYSEQYAHVCMGGREKTMPCGP